MPTKRNISGVTTIPEAILATSGEMELISHLMSADTVREVLKNDTQFVTVVNATKTLGELKLGWYFRWRGLRFYTGTEWKNLDKPLTGYLSDNGKFIRFQTQDSLIFEALLNELKVEIHELGLVLTLPNGDKYVVGNLLPIPKNRNIPYPTPHSSAGFVGDMKPWLERFVKFGIIQESVVNKIEKKNKTLFFVFSAIILALLILLGVLGPKTIIIE